MAVTTIRSLADEIGVTYSQVRHVLRRGYVSAGRPARRKRYLKPGEVRAIMAYFGVCDPPPAPTEAAANGTVAAAGTPPRGPAATADAGARASAGHPVPSKAPRRDPNPSGVAGPEGPRTAA